MKKNNDKKFFIAGLIMMAFSSIVTVYAASYLFESEQVSYDNTSSGLTSTNVQDSLDELYNHATDYTEIKSYFKNNPTSYFNQNDLRIGANDTSNHESYINFYSSNVNRGAIGISNSGDMQIVSKNASGVNGQGTLSLEGNPVQINGSEVAKKPVIVNVHNTITTSTSLSYTGTSVTIPANCFYSLTFKAVFNNSKPQLIGVSTSSSTYREIVSNAAGQHFASVSYSYKTGSSAETFYVWAQYPSANQNNIGITGFYIPG